MSLSTSTDSVRYTGNGSTATYSYTFRVDSSSDLRVIKLTNADPAVKTVLALNTDYTVTGVGASAGGTITLTAGNLTSGYKLIIRRKQSLIQETEIRNEGTYYASEHEDKFDELTMLDQQQQYELDRSLKLPEEVDTADFDMTLPAEIVGAESKVPVTNAAGDGWAEIADWPSVSEIDAAIASAAAAAASAASAAGSATAAGTEATTAGNHNTTASRWAKYTSGTVVDVVTSVDSLEYSAKEYAVGVQRRGSANGGSAKDWATYTSGTVDDSEYSAKKYAQDAAASAASATGVVVSGSRASPNNIIAGTGISYSAANETHVYVQGSGGAVTVTANPRIAAGTIVGQKMLVIGRSATNTLTLANGNGLSLQGNITLTDDDNLYLYWDGTNWSEISRRES